ncbi:MAG: DUF1835 domain-containing protein [Bacteroidia bacterium]
MTYHILNGDSLARQIKQTSLAGHVIICRECLIEGDLKGNSFEELMHNRANYIASAFGDTADPYSQSVVPEFEKIIQISGPAEVCLWFEDDLFCQTNMWFVLSLLAYKPELSIFRIFPITLEGEDHWRGFGLSDSNRLEHAYNRKILFTEADLLLGQNLWHAFQQQDFETLSRLSSTPSECFRSLEDVCQAHIERFPPNGASSRPVLTVRAIIKSGITQFGPLFRVFSEKEGIYGFGDAQVKRFYDQEIGKSD